MIFQLSQLGAPSPFPTLRFPFICCLPLSCKLTLPPFPNPPKTDRVSGDQSWEGPRQFSEDLFHLWNAKPLAPVPPV